MNPYHDDRGRFADSPGGSGGGRKGHAVRMLKALDRERTAMAKGSRSGRGKYGNMDEKYARSLLKSIDTETRKAERVLRGSGRGRSENAVERGAREASRTLGIPLREARKELKEKLRTDNRGPMMVKGLPHISQMSRMARRNVVGSKSR